MEPTTFDYFAPRDNESERLSAKQEKEMARRIRAAEKRARDAIRGIDVAEAELRKRPKRAERTRAGMVDRLESAVEAAWKAAKQDPTVRAQARKAKEAWAESESLRWRLAMSGRRIAHGEARKLAGPFLGEQDQLEPLLSCADLFLLPSEQESFGLTALEAMNCGVPVIATDIGGLPELVVHGETGYLFPIGETERMAEAAVALLRDHEQHEIFGRKARDRAVQVFNARQIIPQYEAFYEEVLQSST